MKTDPPLPQFQAPAHTRRGLLTLNPQNPERCCAEPTPTTPSALRAPRKLEDDTFPAYSMGRAAEILGVTQAFLRGLDAGQLLISQRSPGEHSRYSHYQLRLAGCVRELVDAGNALPDRHSRRPAH